MSKPSSSHTEREGGEGVSLESLNNLSPPELLFGDSYTSSMGVTGCIGNMYEYVPFLQPRART